MRARTKRKGATARAWWLCSGLVALGVAPAAAQRSPGGPGWELRIPAQVAVEAGATAPLPIAIAVDRGLTVSKDAAVIIDLAPEDGASVKKKRLGRGDAVDPEADAPRFAVALRGDAPGEHALGLHVRFWLCGTRSCRPVDVRRTATIAVAAVTTGIDAGLDAP